MVVRRWRPSPSSVVVVVRRRRSSSGYMDLYIDKYIDTNIMNIDSELYRCLHPYLLVAKLGHGSWLHGQAMDWCTQKFQHLQSAPATLMLSLIQNEKSRSIEFAFPCAIALLSQLFTAAPAIGRQIASRPSGIGSFWNARIIFVRRLKYSKMFNTYS